MDTDSELHSADVVQAESADAFTIATLATELDALVDQLESDLATRMTLRAETAARIRELRESAERLFANIK